MNGIEQQAVMLDEKACVAMVNFLTEARKKMSREGDFPTMEILPCDDPLEGLRGYLAFVNGIADDEPSIYFCWRFREKIKNYVNMWSGKETAEEMMKECLNPKNGWTRHDDPKARKIGFIHTGKSEWRHIRLPDFKTLDQEVRGLSPS